MTTYDERLQLRSALLGLEQTHLAEVSYQAGRNLILHTVQPGTAPAFLRDILSRPGDCGRTARKLRYRSVRISGVKLAGRVDVAFIWVLILLNVAMQAGRHRGADMQQRPALAAAAASGNKARSGVHRPGEPGEVLKPAWLHACLCESQLNRICSG